MHVVCLGHRHRLCHSFKLHYYRLGPFTFDDEEGAGPHFSMMTGYNPHPQDASAFLRSDPVTRAGSLAMLHLKRDSTLPVNLRESADEGYAEGAVTNTRFGSFPHSTLIGLKWGSQVRASKVDTGTRGRKGKKAEWQVEQENANGGVANPPSSDGKAKRKSDEMHPEPPSSPSKKTKQGLGITSSAANTKTKVPVDAGSGFIHVLQPTPEGWTSSLDHRTQVVYTPDYSYILERLRVRPGSTLIEAGAGSGSFTHAAARAIFNGYPECGTSFSKKKRKLGQVYSFEYHEPRVQTLRDELRDHGLDGVVHLTHRDVCNDGFAFAEAETTANVDAVFLDLPAPWLALKHLNRSPSSPLNAGSAVQICTFSPCIEQVMATVTEMRKLGWTDISMSEVQHRRIDVRRERVGLKEEGLRGVNASAASVDEAIARLREVESKLTVFHANGKDGAESRTIMSKQERLEKIKREQEGRKLYKEGNLVHRTEPEVKTHTSYLVFATLPKAWSEQDETACLQRWPVDEVMTAAR